VRAAILNSRFEFPQTRITANLAPAFLRKVGPGFDAALALGVMAASGQVPAAALRAYAVFGELSLSGDLRDSPGALAVAEGAGRAGLTRLIVPSERGREAALVDGLEVIAVPTLRAAAEVVMGARAPDVSTLPRRPGRSDGGEPDLADIRGHATPLLALEIAAAGGHNLLLEGAPGTGKTMLARRLVSILPPMTRRDAVEVTRIHSVVGLCADGLIMRRPFRAPHHTISAAGLVGGGSPPRPGEATLANHGVLFLDELSEFQRSSLEALRQPLEDGRVTIVRGQRALVFPTRFMLVAASNPCPCGVEGSRCTCTPADLGRYRRRLSGPLLDRIDIFLRVERPRAEALRKQTAPRSAEVAARVVAARERQQVRLAGQPETCNAQLTSRQIRELGQVTPSALRLLAELYDRHMLSARGHTRILRVARTVADLDGSDVVGPEHIDVAASLRLDDGPPLAEAA
jgi:magnesium chelatase family protein